MIKNVKRVDQLRVSDLENHSIWQYSKQETNDETFVRPVGRVPVANLAGKIIGTRVLLANGQRAWALIGNIDQANARLTEHFLTLSIEHDTRWFTLSRYHDFDYAEKGPEGLARFLGLPIGEVFPITYDIREFVKGGDVAALVGQIPEAPRERLSRSEIIAMAVP
jgi:hypothetical protein